ncbi:hypothetical protein [Microlunatus parietis]|uniref:Uncharacterized protein n=1 Tax=Microlunatus parietis TaxID=682979 RepID=A0A7Y9I3A4_9ACTN|nr:hypothetical protein [Microlunatus parietis]NYE69468.1 hypothetical protein [Microlunatus parietis]
MIIGLPVIIGAVVLIVVLARRKPARTPTPPYPPAPNAPYGPPAHRPLPAQGWEHQRPPHQGPPHQGPAGPGDGPAPG